MLAFFVQSLSAKLEQHLVMIMEDYKGPGAWGHYKVWA